MNSDPTLGEINKNPFNLRYVPTIAWEGLANPPHDAGGFCRFTTIAFGLRAGMRDLYVAIHRGYDTIRKLVTHFAPPSENETDAYVAHVAQWTGRDADAALTPLSIADLQNLGAAFIRQENRVCIYTDDELAAAAMSAVVVA